MGIPTGARRYHSGKRAASKASAVRVHIQLIASREKCPKCGQVFDPAPDGKHYLIGKIPCDWKRD